MSVSVVILAAGQGTRMRSSLPKVLHPLAGKPMLEHVVEAAWRLQPTEVNVVYGHGADQVLERLEHLEVQWVEQDRQLGTGHAVAQAMPSITGDPTVLILYGDVPLIRTETLQGLVEMAGDGVSLLTARLDVPKGYGRIVRDPAGRVCAIVEEKDASPEQRLIREVNTGVLAAPAARLKQWIASLDNNNAQGEYYLTDIIAMAVNDGVDINTVEPQDEHEFLGVNDKTQLAGLERAFQLQQARALMTQGVTLMDPARFDLRGEVTTGRDCFIDVNVVFEGKVCLGDGVRIGPGCVIRDAIIGDNVEIKAHCVIDEASIAKGAIIGPFARLRPGAELGEAVHVGNFVEIKKSRIDTGSKVNHLSYIGDTVIGKRVNVGAGTITCNYDGANKHLTIIEDDAFIGSDTQLVAPVTVGAGATIGAGSTIVRDTPPGELTISRVKQETRPGWKRPAKTTSKG